MWGVRKAVMAGVILALAGCSAGGVPDSKPDAAAKPAANGFLAGLFSGGAEAGQDAAAKPKPGKRPKLPAPLARVAIAGGDVVVAGPDGYCVDPTTLQSRAERGFAMIASCNILSDGKVGDPVAPMLVSVTVGPRGDRGDLPGPRAIASAAGVPLLAAETADGFVAAQLGAGGDSVLSGGDPRYWRGAFDLNGRLIGLALYAPEGSSLARESGAAMLARVKTRITTQSGGDARPLAARPEAETQKEGLLGRLFKR